MFEEIYFKIIKRFQTIRFCCFCNTVDDRRAGGSIDCIYHFPVLLSNTETANRTFTDIIVYWNIPIFQKASYIFSVYNCRSKRQGHKTPMKQVPWMGSFYHMSIQLTVIYPDMIFLHLTTSRNKLIIPGNGIWKLFPAVLTKWF